MGRFFLLEVYKPVLALLKTESFINGQWLAGSANRRYPVINPATGEQLALVADCTRVDTEIAIESAQAAFVIWSNKSAPERALLMRRWFELMMANQQALAELMTYESGKPLAESMAEVSYGASFVEWFAEEAKRINGDVLASPFADRELMTLRQAVGVCAAITPWNFPLAMITRKCAPALAAGCTMVVKPAEATPLTALALADLSQQAGIPAGVLNIVTAAQGKEVGECLATHPVVKKMSFTGSTAVGKLLLRQCADTVKRTSMELGGNAPFIVFDDADITEAVKGAIASKFRNTGQTCVCTNRFLVHEAIYSRFAKALAEAVAELQVGNGMDKGVEQGPLISKAAFDKVKALVDEAVTSGARVLVGGNAHKLGGQFYQPTVLADVSAKMTIAQQEVFGPVATLIPFASEEQAIALANDTPYGLAAYFYTQNHARIWRVAKALEYGMVGVNEGIISTTVAPFGGVKESGLGREGGNTGIDEYLEQKYLCLGGLS